MSFFNELRHELETYLDAASVEQIHQAYLFAESAHTGQQRHSGDPYIIHPLAVALTLATMRMDAQVIMAAILHDIIEDTATDKAGLIARFGKNVAELVDGVSKLVHLQCTSRAEAQAENFRKMLLAMAKDIRVIIIKLADRLHNMRTLGVLPPEKQRRIARETLEIYAPIASRLGMHAFHIEFEDLAFAALFPFRYRVLRAELERTQRRRKKIMGQIETTVRQRLEHLHLPPSLVWGRQKHLYSYYKEMREQQLSFSELMDVYTCCIVVDTVDTCYRTLGAVHGLYKPLPEHFRDYIALPKANGYQALHTTLFGPQGHSLEIQIRTVVMDNQAGNGVVSSWLSQSGEHAFDPAARKRANEWLKRLLNIQQSTGNSLEFMANVKSDLFPEEIYVFTPSGEIMELPKGATPIDFAYAVHSDVGDHCVAARINKHSAPLSTRLSNGQTIEIITAQAAQPNPAWLKFIVTGKAHSNIRHFLKSQRRLEAMSLGKRLLEHALQRVGSAWKKIPNHTLEQVVFEHHCKTPDELVESVGLGQQNPYQIAEQLLPNVAAKPTSTSAKSSLSPLAIKGDEGKILQLAACCHPIPGDEIIGVLQSGHGVAIHTKQCEQIIKNRQHPQQLITVAWDANIQGDFKVEIRLAAKNQPGVLAQLTSAIAYTKANIDNLKIVDKDEHYSNIFITLAVQHRNHLAQVIRRLHNIKAILRLTRSK